MAFDYKKEYKEFYMPKNKPSIVTIPGMNYIAVRGHGDPNAEDGEYKQSIGLLYGIAFPPSSDWLAARSERFLASLADTWLMEFRSLISSFTLPPVSA